MSRRPRIALSAPLARSLALTLGLLLIGPAPSALFAAEQDGGAVRRPAPAPDRDELRRRLEETISVDKLLDAQSRVKLDELPVSYRCEEVRRTPGGDPGVSPRRSSRIVFLDARSLCYGACMLTCLGVGVPFDDCDDMCEDICYGGTATAASSPPPGHS